MRTESRWLPATALSLIGLLGAQGSTARAQPQADDEQTGQPAVTEGEQSSQDAEARALFHAGRVAFDDGRFENALQYFRNAFELSPRPKLLYNIGTAADRLRKDDEALEAFERYLERVPSSDERMAVKARVAVLRTTLAQRAAETPADDDAPPGTGRTASAGPGAGPWILLAGSGAVTLAGGVLLVLALDDISTVEEAPEGTRWSEIEDANDRAPIFSAVGFALIGVGAVGVAASILWLNSADDDALSITITPGGVVLRGKL